MQSKIRRHIYPATYLYFRGNPNSDYYQKQYWMTSTISFEDHCETPFPYQPFIYFHWERWFMLWNARSGKMHSLLLTMVPCWLGLLAKYISYSLEHWVRALKETDFSPVLSIPKCLWAQKPTFLSSDLKSQYRRFQNDWALIQRILVFTRLSCFCVVCLCFQAPFQSFPRSLGLYQIARLLQATSLFRTQEAQYVFFLLLLAFSSLLCYSFCATCILTTCPGCWIVLPFESMQF